jgi:AcrR family transcriptional regulator
VSERAQRADARRNRARLLQAAGEAFAADGLAVPIEEIARRAGVGVGTVYRHFPTKASLFEATVVTRLQALVDEARSLAAAADPGGAFFAFLARLAAEARTRRDLAEAMAASGQDAGAARPLVRDLRLAVGVLLRRAQRAGAARADVGTADVMTLLHAAFLAMARLGAGPTARDRVLAVLSDGLRGRP